MVCGRPQLDLSLELGGAEADLSIEESTEKVIRVIKSVTIDDSGTFKGHDGKASPW
jgi:hypothetical protein